ncbi:MAG: DUF1674 domain-containing protein [Pseudomonadota bacterium]|nr:DUF1674 domain-containing protein [Pseudomonadota bacterium]
MTKQKKVKEIPISPQKKKVSKINMTENEKSEKTKLDPTRYGDWEKGGRCIDF